MKAKKPVLAIVGTGIIGCSVALALRDARYSRRILGFDTDPRSLKDALKSGAIDSALNSLSSVLSADIIILSAPVTAIVSSLRQLGISGARCKLVLDTGSLKAPVMNAASRADLGQNFVGGHPMAGLEKSGPLFARADLFKNRTFFLTPTKETSRAAFELAKELVRACGAVPCRVSAKEHDEIVALTSHLPYLLSVALTELAESQTANFGLLRKAIAGSFADLTRVASTSPRMGADIISGNSASVKKYLRKLLRITDGILAKSKNPKALIGKLERVRAARQRLLSGD